MNESASPTPAVAASDNLLGVRIVAGIIDLVLIAIMGVGLAFLIGDTEADDGGFQISLSGAPFIVYVLLSLGYYFGMEATKGQTVGKMAMGLKVVTADGTELTPGKVAVRTILRIVDGFFFYLVAVVAIAVSKQQQRIGDMAAGTRVERV